MIGGAIVALILGAGVLLRVLSPGLRAGSDAPDGCSLQANAPGGSDGSNLVDRDGSSRHRRLARFSGRRGAVPASKRRRSSIAWRRSIGTRGLTVVGIDTNDQEGYRQLCQAASPHLPHRLRRRAARPASAYKVEGLPLRWSSSRRPERSSPCGRVHAGTQSWTSSSTRKPSLSGIRPPAPKNGASFLSKSVRKGLLRSPAPRTRTGSRTGW